MSAVHYAAEDGGEHAVLAWRPSARFGHRAAPVRLPALDPGAHYLDPDLDQVHSGAVLVHRGLDLRLPTGDYASRLIRLVRVTP